MGNRSSSSSSIIRVISNIGTIQNNMTENEMGNMFPDLDINSNSIDLSEKNLENNPSRDKILRFITSRNILRILNLSDNNLSYIPPTIGNLTSLTHLHLDFNNLTYLPNDIGNLTSLTILFLHCNRLTSLPDDIGNLTQLTSLNLFDNDLTSLPDTISNLGSLTELQISDNRLSSLPNGIWNLSLLSTLNVQNNQLTSLPDIPEDRVTPLSQLKLSGNQNLRRLPDSIVRLSVTTEYIPPPYLEVDSPGPLRPPPPPIFLPPVPGG